MKYDAVYILFSVYKVVKMNTKLYDNNSVYTLMLLLKYSFNFNRAFGMLVYILKANTKLLLYYI